MINFRKAKEQLLQVLISNGYVEDETKSTKGHKVMVNSGNKLILRPNRVTGVYDYYYNVTDSSDWGDTIRFLARDLCMTSDTSHLTHTQYQRIEQELERVSREAIIPDSLHRSNTPPPLSTPFAINRFKVSELGSIKFPINSMIGEQFPLSTQYLFKHRSLDSPILTSRDFKDAFSIIHQNGKDGKEYHNLLFLWRDAAGNIKGGQYKYLQEGKCIKHFLPNSERGQSLWYSNLNDKTALMITEDPLDAIAHRILHPELNYGYACTGGSISFSQVSLIHTLASTHNLPIVLGNDKDIAGQISNLKILDTKSMLNIQYNKQADNIKISLKSSGISLFDGNSTDFELYVYNCAHIKNYQIAVPTFGKDWNDEIHHLRQQSTLLQRTIETPPIIQPSYMITSQIIR